MKSQKDDAKPKLYLATKMKAIHYDAEGDILSITFSEALEQKQVGIELSDNLVFYYNPETKQPLTLILISYQSLLTASTKTPIVMDGLAAAPAQVQATVISMLERAPLTAFMQLIKATGNTPPSSR